MQFANTAEFFNFIEQVALHLSQVEGVIWMPKQGYFGRVELLSQDGYQVFCDYVQAEDKVKFTPSGWATYKAHGIEHKEYVKGSDKIFISAKKPALRVAKEVSSRLLAAYKVAYQETLVFCKAWVESQYQRECLAVQVCEVIGCDFSKDLSRSAFYTYKSLVRKVSLAGNQLIDIELTGLSLDKLQRVIAALAD